MFTRANVIRSTDNERRNKIPRALPVKILLNERVFHLEITTNLFPRRKLKMETVEMRVSVRVERNENLYLMNVKMNARLSALVIKFY